MNSVFLLVNLADFLHQEETNQSREEGTYQAKIEFQRKGHFLNLYPIWKCLSYMAEKQDPMSGTLPIFESKLNQTQCTLQSQFPQRKLDSVLSFFCKKQG